MSGSGPPPGMTGGFSRPCRRKPGPALLLPRWSGRQAHRKMPPTHGAGGGPNPWGTRAGTSAASERDVGGVALGEDPVARPLQAVDQRVDLAALEAAAA